MTQTVIASGIIYFTQGAVYNAPMAKGDRANLESLLRGAWERQKALLGHSKKPEPAKIDWRDLFLAGLALLIEALALLYGTLVLMLAAAGMFWFALRRYRQERKYKESLSFHLVSALLLIFVTTAIPIGVERYHKKIQMKHEKSILSIHTSMAGVYGPNKTSTDVYIDIGNSPEDATQSLDLTIKTIPSRRILSVVQKPTDAGDCEVKPIPLSDSEALIDGKGGVDHLTLHSQDMTNEMNYFFQWKLTCPRVSGKSHIRIQLTASGDVENDAIHLFGTYELIPSQGSSVVKIDETIPVKKT